MNRSCVSQTLLAARAQKGRRKRKTNLTSGTKQPGVRAEGGHREQTNVTVAGIVLLFRCSRLELRHQVILNILPESSVSRISFETANAHTLTGQSWSNSGHKILLVRAPRSSRSYRECQHQFRWIRKRTNRIRPTAARVARVRPVTVAIAGGPPSFPLELTEMKEATALRISVYPRNSM